MSSRRTKTKAEEEVEKIKETIKTRAEQLVVEKFPKKIIEIESLLRGELFQEDYEKYPTDINIPYPDAQTKEAILEESSDEESSDEEEDKALLITKPWLFPKGEVPSNRHIVEMVEVFKPLLVDMMHDLDVIVLAIELMIPSIEAGNNFGVQVQEDTMRALGIVYKDVKKSYYNQTGRYFFKRADLVVKVAKYPQSDDLRRAIQELDEKEKIELIRAMKNLDKHYTTAHDVVTKNLNKIKNPRGASDNITTGY